MTHKNCCLQKVHGVARGGLPALRDGEALCGGTEAAPHQGRREEESRAEMFIKIFKTNIINIYQIFIRKAEQERLEAVKASQANRKVLISISSCFADKALPDCCHS